jgi:hypothetical protein
LTFQVAAQIDRRVVVEQKAVAVGAEDKRHLQRLSVVQALLHPVTDGVIVVLGFDHRYRNIRAIVQNVVRKLRFAATDLFATDNDASLREVNFLTKLGYGVPPDLRDRRRDELGSDVLLRE